MVSLSTHRIFTCVKPKSVLSVNVYKTKNTVNGSKIRHFNAHGARAATPSGTMRALDTGRVAARHPHVKQL